nr:MAG TPA_asm: tail assembly chaperone protein [Caudoviricetes sp.]
MSEVTFELSTPIYQGTEEIKTLTIMRPTLKIIKLIGTPFKVSAKEDEFDIRADRLAQYISKCCALPPSVIDDIDAYDYVQLAGVFAAFFDRSPAVATTN